MWTTAGNLTVLLNKVYIINLVAFDKNGSF